MPPVPSRIRLDTATRALDPPFAVLDLDAFDRNAADLPRRANGLPVRVATKSVRCVELLRRVLARPEYTGLMCYSLDEALWLQREGLSDDLLVAYPCVSRTALRALTEDPAACRAITIMVDSVDHLDRIDAATGSDRPEIRVCLEVDAAWRPAGRLGPRIGPLRSPVHTAEQAGKLAEAVRARDGFSTVGIMVYEGQIAGVGDAPPGRPLRAAAVRWMQRHSATELVRRRADVVDAVRAVSPLEFVNGGGTGCIERTAEEAAVTEIAAGSGLVGPTLFDTYRSFQPDPAALFALPVVRRPARKVATVYGGGYLASGVGTADRLPTPHLPTGLRLTGQEGAGEVQTPVVGAAARQLRLGDRVWFRHAKAGELAERFTHYHLIEGRSVVQAVPTYRGAGKSFG